VRSSTRFDQSHELRDAQIVLGIIEVIVDVQVVDAAPTAADVSVAEVPPEELRIRAFFEDRTVAARTEWSQVGLPAR
jgi:hypothetical protein